MVETRVVPVRYLLGIRDGIETHLVLVVRAGPRRQLVFDREVDARECGEGGKT